MGERAVLPEDLTRRDAATGLPNRRAMLAVLRERLPSGQGGLVLLDLDGWRRLCERMGKGQVQPLLADVAARLREAAGPDGLLYRYAGDAFALLLPDGDRDRAAEAAERLRAAVAAHPFKLSAEKGVTMAATRLTASCSACAWPIDGRSPTVLIETAEMALLAAKQLGRDRVAVAGRIDPGALAEIGVYRGLPCPVLVGRTAEQTRLRQVASDVRHVGATIALVTSPPGFGKSRLLRELSLWARSEKFVVLTAVCQEARATLPYAVLSELLETLLVTDREVALAAASRLAPAARAALAVVVRDFPPGESPVPLDVTQYGKAIFDALASMLEELARGGPLFLLVDEVEHADQATFDVLGAATARRLPVFLAAATDQGPAELGVTPAGEFFRGRGSTFHRLPLPALTAEEMEKMFRAILPDAQVAPEVVKSLVDGTKGNPLHLEETLRALLLRGRIFLKDGKWWVPALGSEDLPDSLDAAEKAVRGALPARANTLLARAAVIGPQVDPELLQEVMGQDEMEMLDLIDEARRARLLSVAESASELLAFPAAYARKHRLASAEEVERREIHARVGVVQEARHGGDVAHLADELAYHYGQAGNQSRAAHFDAIARRRAALINPPRAEGKRRARLDPVKQPLGPSSLEHALAMLRFFTASLRIGKLYPKENQVSATFVAQLRESMEALFASGTGVTISVTPQGPALNGVASDAQVAGEFASLLEERLIESITFLRIFDPARLPDLLQAFSEPFNAVAAAADHWDLFLEKKAIEGFDVVQRAYQARDRVKKGALVRGEEPVPADQMPALRESLRALKAAVENVKLYPPGHVLVEETAEQTVKAWTAFLKAVPAVTLGTAEGDLVVNGLPADKKFFGDAGAFVVKEIDQRGLWSVSLGRGVTGDELRSLIGFLSTTPGGVADRGFTQLAHVVFGSRQYERAAEGEDVRLAPPPKPIRSEIRAREYLALSYEKLLTPKFEEAFSVLVETLAYGARRPLAEQLVDRLADHFHDADLRHRRQALDLLARSLAFASPSCRQVQVARSAPPLKKRMLEDHQAQFFRASADILPIWVPAAATSGCLKELAEITGPVLRKLADADETPAEISAAAEGALQLIPNTGAYPVLLAAVQRQRQEERVLAIGILLAIGGVAVQRLVELVVDEPDLAARQAAALGMSLVIDQVAKDLVGALGPEAPLERFGRVLEVADRLWCPQLSSHFAELVESGPPPLRKEIIRAAEHLPRDVAVTAVRKLLAAGKPERREEAVELAARFRVDQVAADVAGLLEKAEDEHLIRVLCRYFAEVPNPAVAPVLVRIFGARPKLFGLVKGFAAETRAEAVRALSKIKSKEAEETVGQALSDPRLRDFLKDLQKPPEPAKSA
jgi:diguanylate cyclase (GGDEF)-like protein